MVVLNLSGGRLGHVEVRVLVQIRVELRVDAPVLGPRRLIVVDVLLIGHLVLRASHQRHVVDEVLLRVRTERGTDARLELGRERPLLLTGPVKGLVELGLVLLEEDLGRGQGLTVPHDRQKSGE